MQWSRWQPRTLGLFMIEELNLAKCAVIELPAYLTTLVLSTHESAPFQRRSSGFLWRNGRNGVTAQKERQRGIAGKHDMIPSSWIRVARPHARDEGELASLSSFLLVVFRVLVYTECGRGTPMLWKACPALVRLKLDPLQVQGRAYGL